MGEMEFGKTEERIGIHWEICRPEKEKKSSHAGSGNPASHWANTYTLGKTALAIPRLPMSSAMPIPGKLGPFAWGAFGGNLQTSKSKASRAFWVRNRGGWAPALISRSGKQQSSSWPRSYLDHGAQGATLLLKRMPFLRQSNFGTLTSV